jgi:hypothetical protein
MCRHVARLTCALLSGSAIYSHASGLLQSPTISTQQLSFFFVGETKAKYVILASVDLVQWEPRWTNEGTLERLTRTDITESQKFFTVEQRTLPPFRFALVADSGIDLVGAGVMIDSFDSGNTNYTNGQYDSALASDKGDIGVYASSQTIVNVSNANVYGHVLSSTNGLLKVGPVGSVGSIVWHLTGHKGIEKGFLRTDMMCTTRNVLVPFENGEYKSSDDGPQNVNGTQYAMVFGGGNYKLESLSLSNSYALVLGNVSLWVPQGFSLIATSRIDIVSGGELRIYTGSNGLIQNQAINNPGDASRCIIAGLPSCTNLTVSGSATNTFCIYAPSANFLMSGSTNLALCGAVVCKGGKLVGACRIHFDENLLRAPPEF